MFCGKITVGIVAFAAGILLSLIFPAGFLLFVTASLLICVGIFCSRDRY